MVPFPREVFELAAEVVLFDLWVVEVTVDEILSNHRLVDMAVGRQDICEGVSHLHPPVEGATDVVVFTKGVSPLQKAMHR